MFQTFERIKELANKQGLSINALEEKLGYSKNTLYSLKKQKASTDRMQEITDYLNVSLDYLLGRTDNPSIVRRKSEPDDIDEIIANAMMFDGEPLTDDDKRAIRGIIAGYMNSKEK
ncbi:MAG TPA: XRE family transcriptional regulator [Streptococcus sp.]|nr:XRE family transcriptional regulator [Streptococcus sp.]